MDRTEQARLLFSSPEAALARVRSQPTLAHQINTCSCALRIARKPEFRFGLETADCEAVAAALADELERLKALALPIAAEIRDMRLDGQAYDTIVSSLGLQPGEAAYLLGVRHGRSELTPSLGAFLARLAGFLISRKVVMEYMKLFLVNNTGSELVCEPEIRASIIATGKLPVELADVYTLNLIKFPWHTPGMSGEWRAIISLA